ncbi:hypothetical protein CWS35_07880 [Bradyrhizobium sp. SK17]|nr:hypothetical protein CWS35_07880 [Bradyrhizobium sp. SK17]
MYSDATSSRSLRAKIDKLDDASLTASRLRWTTCRSGPTRNAVLRFEHYAKGGDLPKRTDRPGMPDMLGMSLKLPMQLT